MKYFAVPIFPHALSCNHVIQEHFYNSIIGSMIINFINATNYNQQIVYLCGAIGRWATDPLAMRSSPATDIYVMHC